MTCPCGNNLDYTECCLLLHTKKLSAKTAEQLMRSRYSAFVKQELDYLKRTMIKTASDDFSKQKLKAWLKNVVWRKLIVLSTNKGQEHDSEGWVKFQAEYTENKIKKIMIENSYFRKVHDKWLYVGEDDALL